LNREPDKALIKWPGRKPIIDKQIQNLKSLTDV
jgi:molybdopterin-guanine dinucleotide biosynthesis protein A